MVNPIHTPFRTVTVILLPPTHFDTCPQSFARTHEVLCLMQAHRDVSRCLLAHQIANVQFILWSVIETVGLSKGSIGGRKLFYYSGPCVMELI